MRKKSICLLRILDWCKSWPITRQLVVFNLLALAVVILLLFSMIGFNLLYLQYRTVDQIGQSLDSQSNHNMRALITEAGGAAREILYEMEVTLEVLSSMLVAITTPGVPYALDRLPDHTYDDLPQSCLQIFEELYGPEPVCMQYSSSRTLGETWDIGLMDNTTRFDAILPVLGSLLGGQFIRILIYFDRAKFIRVFPGSYLPEEYAPQQQQWWLNFTYANRSNSASDLYNDTIGISQELLAIMVPMYTALESTPVGVAVAEAPVKLSSQKLCNVTYLTSGKSVLMTNTGTLFDTDFMGWNVSNIQEVSDDILPVIVNSPSNDATEVISFTYMSTAYRLIAKAISGHNTTSTWYYLLLVVPESEIMHTRDTAWSSISTAAHMSLLSTALVAPVVCFSLFLCVSMFTSRVVKPLHGIVSMSEDLSKADSEEMKLLQRELQDMEEGKFQVQKLVKAFKELAMKLTDQHGPNFHEEISCITTEDYPRNDLKDAPIPWESELKLLRNNA